MTEVNALDTSPFHGVGDEIMGVQVRSLEAFLDSGLTVGDKIKRNIRDTKFPSDSKLYLEVRGDLRHGGRFGPANPLLQDEVYHKLALMVIPYMDKLKEFESRAGGKGGEQYMPGYHETSHVKWTLLNQMFKIEKRKMREFEYKFLKETPEREIISVIESTEEAYDFIPIVNN